MQALGVLYHYPTTSNGTQQKKLSKKKPSLSLNEKVVPQAPANRFSQSLKSKPSRNISTINKSLVCECGFSS